MIKQPSSRTCFLCGRDNEYGLKMTWYNNPDEDRIQGTIVIPEHFNGYPGIVHGGIVASVLDETAGRAIMLDGNFDNLFVTLKLEISYKKPTPTNTPLKALGWIERDRGRVAQVAGEIRLPDNSVSATCKAIVVRPTQEISASWEAERKYWKVDQD